MWFYTIYLTSYIFFSGVCYINDLVLETDQKKMCVKKKIYYIGLPLVMFNIVCMSYIFFSIIDYIYMPRKFNIIFGLRDIIITKYVGSYLFYEIHQRSHKIPFLFRLHKVHHCFDEPVGMVAAYAHPLDYLFGNMIPICIIPYILGTDIYTMTCMAIYGVYKTIIVEHSDFYGMNSNFHHIIHHRKYMYNYGAIWIDNLHGSMFVE